MEMEDITMTGTVGWQDQISASAMRRERQGHAQAEMMDDATDESLIFMPTPLPVWPRVWPGL